MTNDATVLRLSSHSGVTRCLRVINSIAQTNLQGIERVDINGGAQPNGNHGRQLTDFDRCADLSSGACGWHRLRDQRRDQWLAHDDDHATFNALLMPV
jgi:hypothetical protein